MATYGRGYIALKDVCDGRPEYLIGLFFHFNVVSNLVCEANHWLLRTCLKREGEIFIYDNR